MEAKELVDLYKKREAAEEMVRHAEFERDFEEITELLDKCYAVRDLLTTLQFEKTDSGHFEFKTLSYPANQKIVGLPADSVDIVYPVYVLPDDERIGLGQIGRCHLSHEGWADSFITMGGEHVKMEDEQPLTPDDPRWEAVVFPLMRAVAFCKEKLASDS